MLSNPFCISRWSVATLFLLTVSLVGPAAAQDDSQLLNLDELGGQVDTPAAQPATPGLPDPAEMLKAEGFKIGPTTGDLGNAKLELGPGWAFTGRRGHREWVTDNGDAPYGNERGVLQPVAWDKTWVVFFSFDDVGYIEDAENEELDADEIYDGYRQGVKEQNKRLQAAGSTGYTLKGWKTKPHYEAATNTLEWCLIAEIDGQTIVNHEIRILGRKGVMSATIACSPEELDRIALKETRQALEGFSFESGESYAEYQKGDKIAKYGLAALVAGGSLALAAKSGLLGKLLKPIIAGVVIVGAVIAKFFKGIFGGFSKES